MSYVSAPSESSPIQSQAQTLWRDLTGRSFPKPGETRWYNWVDVYRAILENVDRLGPILLSAAYRLGPAGIAWAQANATTASRKCDFFLL